MPEKFDVASELKARIAKENDEDRRTMLLLLLGVFEANLAGMNALAEKIDALRNDEKGLREAVLNGHEQVHHGHHEWIAAQMDRAKETEVIRTWALRRMASSCETGCEWAETKRLEELEAAKTAKADAAADRRTARNAAINQGVTILVSVLLGIGGTATAVVVALARGWLGPVGG